MGNRITALVMGWLLTIGTWQAAAASEPLAFTAQPALMELALRIVQSMDNTQLPFAIVDKDNANMVVFRGDGRVAGGSTILLGLTPGDRIIPGVGQRAQTGSLTLDDRTTPGGRFVSQPGRNVAGEHVIWIDYPNALAIHRLRPGPSRERRALRMASSNPRDKRISGGCVVVPEAFYDAVIQPVLGEGRGMVYILPESGHWQAWQVLALDTL